MKKFVKKGILNKLIIVLIVITLFNVVMPTKVVFAGDGIGGRTFKANC